MGNCKNKQKKEREICELINKIILKNKSHFEIPEQQGETIQNKIEMKVGEATKETETMKGYEVNHQYFMNELHIEPNKNFLQSKMKDRNFHYENISQLDLNDNETFVPIYSWNNLRVGMTDDGILCITKTVDDSTLWKISKNEKGCSFQNKRTNKYANPKLGGGIGSWSTEPVYFTLFSAQIFLLYPGFSLYYAMPYIAKDFYGNITRCLMIKNSNGLCWNIWQNQQGDGAWIVLFQEQIQGHWNGSLNCLRNETWMVEKKFPSNWSGLCQGLIWKKE